jgi:CRP/FNR family transcriptional regulator
MHLAAWAVTRRYRRGDIVHPERAGGSDVGLLAEGAVEGYLLARDGKTFTVGRWAAGDLFRLAEDAKETPTDLVLEAHADGTVAHLVPEDHFFDVVADHPKVMKELLRGAQRRIEQQRQAMGELAFCSVRVRVAHELSRLATTSEGRVVRGTRQELAARIGTGREEVSRAVAELRRRHLIECPAQAEIVVLDPERLVAEDQTHN